MPQPRGGRTGLLIREKTLACKIDPGYCTQVGSAEKPSPSCLADLSGCVQPQGKQDTVLEPALSCFNCLSHCPASLPALHKGAAKSSQISMVAHQLPAPGLFSQPARPRATSLAAGLLSRVSSKAAQGSLKTSYPRGVVCSSQKRQPFSYTRKQ